MIQFPIQIDPLDAAQELADFNLKVVQGMQTLSTITDDEIQYGASERHAVYREDKMVLYHFEPLVDKPFAVPVLISYALVNRPYMTDLQDNRSLVKNLLQLGLDVYLIDWGYPGREDRWLTLDDYINGYIDTCVDVVRERHGLEKINLLGICQGGAFSLCYTALHPDKINNLVTMVTPVDFGVEDGLLNRWTGCQVGSESVDADLMVEALGNIPGDFMNFGYLMLKPYQLNIQKYAAFTNLVGDRRKVQDFLRMEKWIFDSPDQAGEAWRQFIKDFYQANKLIKGEVEIGGQRVDLRAIDMPVLNIYADQDHLVPPSSSKALETVISSTDYTEANFPVGHIGMYVSGKVQRTLPPLITDWLKERK
ncbi:MAG: class III poly(R)-hydroxyalkanoic acid synthase subunit PhaC [Caldilineaceae bacterium]|nr:class III poly(R)-hydroxyalkanoic acid synthase subunit PhaC [Caldilineaceae bacterium]